MGTDNKGNDTGVLNAIKMGIEETLGIIGEIREGLLDCSRRLRVEQEGQVFTTLSEGIKNLSYLMDFIKELKNGLDHLMLKGCNLPEGSLSCWDRSLEIFKEMHSAFERKDWITVSDIIEYELYPLLIEGEKGLSKLKDGIF